MVGKTHEVTVHLWFLFSFVIKKMCIELLNRLMAKRKTVS